MDGKAEAVLRFALSTLFMKQGRSVVGRSEGSGGSVEAERNGLALGVDGASDYGFEPDEVDVGADACDEHLPEADAGQQLLFVVLACMGRLRDMCEDSYHDGEREVEGGFRGVARELREYTALHGTFADLLCLLMDLLRAADAEGETMDAASISHDTETPSSRFDEVVEFLVAALNDARDTTVSEWVSQSLDEVEATVHGSS